mmetsp:Transcript_23990/g.56567  ORF Transcript_23990/g.56567 Transcript_23990/m.56567 type:complete len:229 (-) Transcript_23990:168-854(-)
MWELLRELLLLLPPHSAMRLELQQCSRWHWKLQQWKTRPVSTKQLAAAFVRLLVAAALVLSAALATSDVPAAAAAGGGGAAAGGGFVVLRLHVPLRWLFEEPRLGVGISRPLFVLMLRSSMMKLLLHRYRQCYHYHYSEKNLLRQELRKEPHPPPVPGPEPISRMCLGVVAAPTLRGEAVVSTRHLDVGGRGLRFRSWPKPPTKEQFRVIEVMTFERFHPLHSSVAKG